MPRPSRNKRISAAREILHDWICASEGCRGDNDHARRTQHEAARQIADATDPAEIAAVVHDAWCMAAYHGGATCERREQHVAEIRLLHAVRPLIEGLGDN